MELTEKQNEILDEIVLTLRKIFEDISSMEVLDIVLEYFQSMLKHFPVSTLKFVKERRE